MSLGYCGKCVLLAEDMNTAVYSYSGENWNDGGLSQEGDIHLQDGVFIINKNYLAYRLLHAVFETYQKDDRLPKSEVFIQ